MNEPLIPVEWTREVVLVAALALPGYGLAAMLTHPIEDPSLSWTVFLSLVVAITLIARAAQGSFTDHDEPDWMRRVMDLEDREDDES